MFGLFGALSGYIKAQKTGRGESIDVAQYEILMRVDSAYWSMHMTDGFPLPRTGSGNPSAAAMDNYRCKNGNLITILVVGFVAIKGAMELLGLDFGSEEWPVPANQTFYAAGSDEGLRLDKKVREYCAAHTVKEVDSAFSKAGCPCSPIMT